MLVGEEVKSQCASTSTQPAVSSSKGKGKRRGKGSGFDWTQCKSEGGSMNCALCSDVKGGALPCDKIKPNNWRGYVHGGKSSVCPDDKIMVNKKFFYQDGGTGRGVCKTLTHIMALRGQAFTSWKFPTLAARQGKKCKKKKGKNCW